MPSIYEKKSYKSKLHKDSDTLSEQLKYMSQFDKDIPPVPMLLGNFVTVNHMS